MKTHEPLAGLRLVERKFEATSGAMERRLLRLLAQRLVGELAGDVAAVVATVTPDFRLVNHAEAPGPPICSADELGAALAGAHQAGVRAIWLELESLVVDSGGLAFAGATCIVMTGALLQRADDQAGLYLLEKRVAGFFETRGDLISVETVYSPPDDRAPVRVESSLLPDAAEARAILDRLTEISI